jgi:leucyl aminopeptidase (aminopeptidase T)
LTVLPEYQAGARNAIRVCLGVGSADRVAVIRNAGAAEIADAIEEECASAGAEVRGFPMEDWTARPASELPAPLAAALREFKPRVSLYVGNAQAGEIRFRQQMIRLLTVDLRCRHGHMVGIDRTLMLDGMVADYDRIYELTRAVYEIVRRARRIEVRTSLGTQLTGTFDANLRWVPCDGRYHEPGQWGNLPEGETYTAPLSVEGVIVGEEMGDDFAPRYGLFKQPVRMRIDGGWLADFEAPGDDRLRAEIEAYMGRHPNSRRVGEFAIGTNIGLSRIVGNFLQDEKFPGVHIAFGDPYGHETGADWECPTHVDVLASHADVWVDGRQIMAGSAPAPAPKPGPAARKGARCRPGGPCLHGSGIGAPARAGSARRSRTHHSCCAGP